ncbi:hypothetical protein [Bradyrhizobium sp. Ec3.3]|uniref:hypothetical protein n=1 Tax=Bradyrhizobium sp. Ec3.3 TaxID=189753 RepID=UPI000422531A|nr:hypothetical protein [Bradyrhizobium sp. Ec3.3]
MAEIYRQRIAALYESLHSEDDKAEAAEVTLVPDEAELAIVPRGDVAAILRFAANKKNPDVPFGSRGFERLAFARESLVAGGTTTDTDIRFRL